ncbi:MAG: 3-isopropylmalate dehydrogenase [Gammaproteobacteria bacterium]|nr:3-isopropylmalate dehydrogenase [Gammaproteobacteria bacterium]
MSKSIVLLPGDGIGPEVVGEAVKVIGALKSRHGLDAEMRHAPIGGSAYDETGEPLPERTLELCREADAILLGAVGGRKWDAIDYPLRPEQGLLALRSKLELFANLRPAIAYARLSPASSLHPRLVAGLDLMIVRELTGGIYFGEPRGIREEDGERIGFNTLVYSESEIERIARKAFKVAAKRRCRVCSVDKANVLESSRLWRETVGRVGRDFMNCELTHMYVDNAAMQLVREPKQFDVIVTGNMFGDILSDIAAQLTGSIGMLPSASLGKRSQGLYEPIHGSAPDIAGQDKANPLAAILSVAMLLRHSLDEPDLADRVQSAVARVIEQGCRTSDIYRGDGKRVGTREMGDAVVTALVE